MSPKLPRIRTGVGLIDAVIINWANWIEYANNLNGAFPVKVTKGSAGPIISVDTTTGHESFIALVTTAVTAGSGTGSTTGTGVARKVKDLTVPLVVDPNVSGVGVRNYHEKGFLLNAVVEVSWRNSEWWVTDVGRCADYGP